MSEPARASRRHKAAPPPFDQEAVDRTIRLHRARRQARLEHADERRVSRSRFYLVLSTLLVLSLVIAIAVWHEIQRMFGL